MKIRLASPLQKDSVVDGTGIRTVIWTQGCAHDCPFCHNPGTHAFNAGIEYDTEEIKEELAKLEGQKGITFSGGDPLYQIDATIELAKYVKELGMDVWVYTGFTYEEVAAMPKSKELFKYIDVLVDGKFEIENRSLDAPFRGSTNQRIIDIPATKKSGKIVLIEELMQKRDVTPLYKKEEDIFI